MKYINQIQDYYNQACSNWRLDFRFSLRCQAAIGVAGLGMACDLLRKRRKESIECIRNQQNSGPAFFDLDVNAIATKARGILGKPGAQCKHCAAAFKSVFCKLG